MRDTAGVRSLSHALAPSCQATNGLAQTTWSPRESTFARFQGTVLMHPPMSAYSRTIAAWHLCMVPEKFNEEWPAQKRLTSVFLVTLLEPKRIRS